VNSAHSSQTRLMDSAVVRSRDEPILDERVFHQMISLERKRTERSQKPFLLILLELQTQEQKEDIFHKIVSVLAPAIRETDVVGWYESSSALGIIFSGLHSDTAESIPGIMLTRVSGVLYGSLPFQQYNKISFSHFLFPEEWDHDISQRPSHPPLYPDLTRRDKSKRVFSLIKRMMDITGSVLGILLASPVFLSIALAIKLTSKGPILFRQTRVGQYGKPFVFLKFRSMYVNNDPSIHKKYVEQLIRGNTDEKPASGAGIYKLTNDPRITPAGRFLRRTSLDELPQLYHVLVGDMSLVGPRPPLPYEVKAYEIWHRRRVLEAKPGITGLWQVNGRSRVKFDDMVRLDVRYARTLSLWLDIGILLRTPRAVLLGDGAF
jgi:lipopolysaccharide/colanic/teichoic acid biosynthesis glycosyltransferase